MIVNPLNPGAFNPLIFCASLKGILVIFKFLRVFQIFFRYRGHYGHFFVLRVFWLFYRFLGYLSLFSFSFFWF